MQRNTELPKHIAEWNKGALEFVRLNEGCEMIGPSDVEAWQQWAAYFAHIGHWPRLRWMLTIRNAPRETADTETNAKREQRMGAPTRLPEEYAPGWRDKPSEHFFDWNLVRKVCEPRVEPTAEERARVNAGFAKLQAELRENAGKSKSIGSWRHLGAVVTGADR